MTDLSKTLTEKILTKGEFFGDFCLTLRIFFHIKVMFKVGAKMAKKNKENFFLTHRKTENPRSKKFLHLKLICIHHAHQKPQKSNLVEVKMHIWTVLVCLVSENQF